MACSNPHPVAWWRNMAAAVLPAVATAMPGILVGALAVSMQRELGFDEAALGIAIASSRLLGALSSPPLGRFADRTPGARSLRIAITMASFSILSIGLLARGWASLTVLLAVSGVAIALAQATGDVWIARAIPSGRQGLAFGVKQSAPLVASLMAGAAVPTIASWAGWRWAFVASGLATMAIVAVIPGGDREPAVQSRRDAPRALQGSTMFFLALGLSLGGAGAGVLLAFLVTSGVAAGLSESAAGILYAFGAVVGILVRLGLGAWADRRPVRYLLTVATLLAIGSAGYLLFSTGEPAAFVLATPLVFATAWGWPPLFVLSVIRANPDHPGSATSVTRMGGFVGGIIGPMAFGFLARHSHEFAWIVVSAWTLAAAGVVLIARHLVVRDLAAAGQD